MKYIISLDQGTTSSRAILINDQGALVGIEQMEFEQIFPKPGWVEHSPMEILNSQIKVFEDLIVNNNISLDSIISLGITNQRETIVLWDKDSGKPLYNAIVWQDKRTTNICEKIKKDDLEKYIKENTGLVVDSYFSATKIKWIIDNVDGVKNKIKENKVLAGTIDSWLIYNLTSFQSHVTDYTNASRTMIYNIKTLSWDDKILNYLDISKSILPKVLPSSSEFGTFEYKGIKLPIRGVAGDQQAALFGQACFDNGMVKNTYGTGCFLLMNTGKNMNSSSNGLLTTIACSTSNSVNYALEGSVFIAGAAIQWLRDSLKLIKNASETEKIANSIDELKDIYVVPAFAGLGAPYWDMYSRGAIFGLSRDTGREHIIKATLESLAYQTKDIIDVMERDSNLKLKSLKVDGGACKNDYLMQFQSNLINSEVLRPEIIESTAMGAGYLAGISSSLWDKDKIISNQRIDKKFDPKIDSIKRNKLYKGWEKAVKRTLNWLEN
ncbi:MAG: glycerol kinase [Flammeovirgaceae bacterium]|nr:glycerol kinase [Flammeovirgaceae bacterium]|tara:strand:- start:434 stop:1915 length:1482 start_codon:yes stop_codon:yes gene_type:complete